MPENMQRVGSNADRSAQTTAPINAPWIVVVLIFVFVAVHLLRTSLNEDDLVWFILAFAFTPARYAPPANLLDLAFPGGALGDVWTFVSHMFLHGDWTHLVINCLWMLIFGSVVARRLGPLRFVVFSGLAAAIGAAANLVAYWGSFSVLVGASGAISGQMAASVRLMFAGHGSLAELNRPEVTYLPALTVRQTFANRRAMMFIMVWLGINLVFGAVGIGVSEDIKRIAWEAHAGGFMGGLVLFSWFDRRSMP